jgi:hypothetical protein
MIKPVTDIKTAGNDAETLSDREFLVQLADGVDKILICLERHGQDLERISRQADHLDEQVHAIGQFIEEHRPALARGLALMGSGANLGKWFGGKRKDPDGG